MSLPVQFRSKMMIYSLFVHTHFRPYGTSYWVFGGRRQTPCKSPQGTKRYVAPSHLLPHLCRHNVRLSWVEVCTKSKIYHGDFYYSCFLKDDTKQ